MSYRTIRRAISESTIERKFMLLFGLALSIVIFAVFYWVEYSAERLIVRTSRTTGRHLIVDTLLKTHWKFWNTQPQERAYVEGFIESLEEKNYHYEVFSIHGMTDDSKMVARPARDDWELETVYNLAEQLRRQRDRAAELMAEQQAAGIVNGSVETPPTPGTVRPPGLARDAVVRSGNDSQADSLERLIASLPPIYRDRRHPSGELYQYYQPVVWKSRCLECHGNPRPIDPAVAAGPLDPADRLTVIKVEIPYAETEETITWNRAILITTGIVTVALTLLALYGIVRWVIVRPLQHLRTVSDAISRGQTDMRAELHTWDEFEELAGAFNRMLRSLTDTQRQLNEANESLETRLDELAQLNVQLYEMNRLKSEFLANMSHELRTPLNSIIGFSDVLRGMDTLTDKQKRYAANIQKSGKLLLDLINDILDLAKLEAGRMEVHPTEFSVNQIIHGYAEVVRTMAEQKNLDLVVTVEPDLPPMFQDQTKVQQILQNLLSNAIKFTPDGGRVTVTARCITTGNYLDGYWLEMAVADTGIGIAEEDHEIIFEKFRQSRRVAGEDGLTREVSGTGLGLSIVRELCKLLDGNITFISELGQGSTFTVHLPWIYHQNNKDVDAESRPGATAQSTL